MDRLGIEVEGRDIGELVQEDKEFICNYHSENKHHFISLIMPVRKKGYVYDKLHPIFEMHLPEGYLISIIKKHFSKLVKMDDFGILKVMAPSIKGRISYSPKYLPV